jgi:glucose dehydrogenase
MEEQDHDFSEFEGVKTIYRRSLLPWWIWGMLFVYLGFTTFFLISDAYSFVKGYAFAFDVFQINWLIPYPYYPVVSVLLYLFMLVSFLMLWFEKREAAAIGRICFGIMLVLCLTVFIKGLLSWHFSQRIEIIIFTDVVLRLSDKRKQWKNKAISRRN